MKGIIFDIKRFAVHDGDGIRTTVFFKGCPLNCIWCHNPEGLWAEKVLSYTAHNCLNCGECVRICNAHEIVDGRHIFKRELCVSCGRCEEICPADALKLYGKSVETDELLPILLEDKAFYEKTGGGITLSGGECLCQAEFCRELLKLLKKEGIHTAVDTSGFVPKDAIDAVMAYTDIFLYDIKAYDENVHRKCTGVPNEIILENLKYIDSCGKKTEVRIPYVPDYNSDQIEKIAVFLSGLKNLTRVKLLPYHNYAQSKYEAFDMEYSAPEKVPEKSEIETAVQILKSYGLDAV